MTENSSYDPWGNEPRGRRPFAADGGWQQDPQMMVPSVPLKDLFGVLRRHLRLILAITVLTLVPVIWFVYLRGPRFEAHALIRLVDARRAIAGGLGTETEEQPIGRFTDELLSHVQILQGRTVMGDVVDREGLRLVTAKGKTPTSLLSDVHIAETAGPSTLDLRFEEDGVVVKHAASTITAAYGSTVDLGDVRFTLPMERGAADELSLVVLSRAEAVDHALERLSAAPREGTDVIDVVYTSSDSLLAQRIVNAVVDAYQDYDMRMAQETSSRRVTFLQSQLQQVDSVHARAQDELSEFRAQSQFYFSEGRIGDQQQLLVNLDERWEELAADHRMLRDLLNRIVNSSGEEQARAFRVLIASPEVATNPAISRLYGQLVEYQAQRAEVTAGPLGSTTESADVRRLDTLIAATRSDLVDAAQSHLASLAARLESVDVLRARGRARAQPLPVLQATEDRLMEQVASAGRAAEQLRSELQQARMSQAVAVGRVQVIDYSPGAEPTNSNGPIKVALGLMLGLVFGAGGAFVAEAANTSIRKPQEISTRLGVPQLAIIPRIEVPAERGLRRLTSGFSNGSGRNGDTKSLSAASAVHAAEAYRTLRSNLIFTGRANLIRSLVITSASPGEGKTTTAANLACSLAQQGFNVLLIDADLRNPRLHRVLSLEQEPGFSDVLGGDCPLEEAIRPTAYAGLRLIPAGALVGNAQELLGLPSLRDILAGVREAYDFVLIDTPPVLAAADAAILAAETDAVLMVVRAGQTDRAAADEAMEQIAFAGGRVVGAVLNDPDAELPRYGGYYGAAAYGQAKVV